MPPKKPAVKNPKPTKIVVLDHDFAHALKGVSSGADLERVMAAVIAKQKKSGQRVVCWWLASEDGGRSDVVQLVAKVLLTKKELAQVEQRKKTVAAQRARETSASALRNAVKRERAEYERLKAKFGDSNGDYPEGYA